MYSTLLYCVYFQTFPQDTTRSTLSFWAFLGINEEAILVVMNTNELLVKIRPEKIQVERSMML